MRPRTASDPSPAANPYGTLPPQAFWRTGVAEAGVWGLSGLWRSRWVLPADARFSTFGSCFAQHISRALQARKFNWFNAEPAPARSPAALATAYNYGVFSARTANVYTAAQLLTLVRLAAGEDAAEAAEFWLTPEGRWLDSLRPTIEPDGFASRDEALLSRRSMIRAFARSIAEAQVFVFTMGLTEGWENRETGQVYPLCPGTAGGVFDPERHLFRNYSYPEIRAQMDNTLTLMRRLNPDIRVLFTISPVPLTATASGQHVLVATTHSKSVLRAVAGDMVAADPGLDYFPSYEIIMGAPARYAFFEPNLRSVAPQGVEVVMSHFFAGLDCSAPPLHAPDTAHEAEVAMERQMAEADLVCEELLLERQNGN